MPPLNMFPRSFASKDRAGKATKSTRSAKRSFRDTAKIQLLDNASTRHPAPQASPSLTSAILTLVLGQEQRLFAAHEDVLCQSPYFADLCREYAFDGFSSNGSSRRIDLTNEEPEVFSCVLEYLYKGDYAPRLAHDKRHNTWILEPKALEVPGSPSTPGSRVSQADRFSQATIYLASVGDVILRDTAVYCAADRFGLDELKRLALRKQGLQSGIEVATILRSARFAYANTPDSDSRLRAHYLALIIRSRRTFKRSGTMQMEMEIGGKLFFDLFVAMCNHIDEIAEIPNRTPRTI